MRSVRRQTIRNATRAREVCVALVADTPWLRFRGLLGRAEPQPGRGLLLLPSRGIHTFFMQYAIDTVLLDREMQVLRLYEQVRPWRIRLAPAATYCVLEMRAGEISRTGLAVGDRLETFASTDPVPAPAAELSYSWKLSAWSKALLAALLTVQVVVCWAGRVRSLQGRVDLRAYYAAGTLARHSGVADVYRDAAEGAAQQATFHDGSQTLHFLYPPFAVLPCIPLSLLPYRAVFLLVLGGNVVCLLLCARLLAGEHPEWGASPGLLCVLALAFFPTAIALMQGQVSCLVLLLLVLLYRCERHGQPLRAGLCLAAGLLNLQVVLPVALLYLLWRRYRVVAGFAMGAAALLLLSLAVSGVEGLRGYATRLHGVGAATLLQPEAAHLRYGMQTAQEPNLHGLATLLAGAGTGGALLTVLLSVAVLLWAARQRPGIGVAVPAALLVSYHLQPYSLTLLLLPLALVTAETLQQTAHAAAIRQPARWLLAGGVLLLTAPVAAVLLVRGTTVWYLLGSLAVLAAAAGNVSAEQARVTLPARAGFALVR